MLGQALLLDGLPSPLASNLADETKQSRWGARASHQPRGGAEQAHMTTFWRNLPVHQLFSPDTPLCAKSSDQQHTLSPVD